MKNHYQLLILFLAFTCLQITYAQPRVGLAYSVQSNDPVFGCLDSVLVSWNEITNPGEPANFGISQINPSTGAYGVGTTIMPGRQVSLLARSTSTDVSRGVTLADYLLLEQHLLGIKLIDDPYRLLAADVNGSRSITSSDVVELRKIILKENVHPAQVNYRLLPADLAFTNPQNPFTASGVYDLYHVYTMPNMPDFYAVKIGDIDGDACDATTSLAGTQMVLAQDRMLQVGEEFELTLSIPALLATAEFQLHHPDLELVSFAPALAGVPLSDIQTRIALLQQDFAQFKILFKAKKADLLSNMLSFTVNSGLGITDLFERYALELVFLPTSSTSHLVNQQNILASPNPFQTQTTLFIGIEESQMVDIQLFDAQGKLVHTSTSWVSADQPEVKILGAHLPQAGVYTCVVRHHDGVLTSRLICQK